MCRILVVDDDAELRELVCATLRQRGHEVDEVENGRAALEHLLREPRWVPCVLLADLRMPVMDGWELIAALRLHIHWQSIPVVVFSSTIEEDHAPPVLGARAYWQKPISLERLERLDEQCLVHGGHAAAELQQLEVTTDRS